MSLRRSCMPIAILLLLSGCASGHGEMPFAEDVRASMNAREDHVHQVAWGEATVSRGDAGRLYDVSDANGPYLLDTGDRLRIFVYGQPNLSRVYVVDQSGKISVPLIGNIAARGLTTDGLTRVIARKLGAEYVRDPQVTVDVQQNRPFFIFGEVRNGGQFPYVSGMTVETAVAIAGGFSERASTRSFRISRRVDGMTEVFEAPAYYVLKPGDTVFVYERFL